MKEFWDSRYAEAVYAYGKEPNQFFRDTLKKYQVAGHILLPAEGEGRNAVHAAKEGLAVTAVDISEEGKNKAMQLAKANNVSFPYTIGSLSDQAFKSQSFEAVGLIFAHFPPDLLHAYHQEFINLLRPGGLLILEGFSKNHLEKQRTNPQAGGPQNIDMLFSLEMIKADFGGLEVLELKEQEVALAEGPYHQGLGSVVRFVGRKED